MPICLPHSVYGCFHVTMAELNGCNIKTKIFIWPFTKTVFLPLFQRNTREVYALFYMTGFKNLAILAPFALSLSTPFTGFYSYDTVAQILNMAF